jgi:hypothetical protein
VPSGTRVSGAGTEVPAYLRGKSIAVTAWVVGIGRAFSPLCVVGTRTWGVAPGWYRARRWRSKTEADSFAFVPAMRDERCGMTKTKRGGSRLAALARDDGGAEFICRAYSARTGPCDHYLGLRPRLLCGRAVGAQRQKQIPSRLTPRCGIKRCGMTKANAGLSASSR